MSLSKNTQNDSDPLQHFQLKKLLQNWGIAGLISSPFLLLGSFLIPALLFAVPRIILIEFTWWSDFSGAALFICSGIALIGIIPNTIYFYHFHKINKHGFQLLIDEKVPEERFINRLITVSFWIQIGLNLLYVIYGLVLFIGYFVIRNNVSYNEGWYNPQYQFYDKIYTFLMVSTLIYSLILLIVGFVAGVLWIFISLNLKRKLEDWINEEYNNHINSSKLKIFFSLFQMGAFLIVISPFMGKLCLFSSLLLISKSLDGNEKNNTLNITENEDLLHFCPFCGEKLDNPEKIKCPECQKNLRLNE